MSNHEGIPDSVSKHEIEKIKELILNQYGLKDGRKKIPEDALHLSGGNMSDFHDAINDKTLILEDFTRQADGTIHCMFRPTSGTGGIMNLYIKPEALKE